MTAKSKLAIITQNARMRELISEMNHIADSDTSVLLIGETGVGKEVFAEYLHRTSNRNQKPFIKIGLTALPTELMASELFGFEKGSFTSALNEKKGLFEIAHTGSLFFDDIDDVPMDIQAKLLRVLESREIMRIGGSKSIPVDIRLITASKMNLSVLVEQKKFRSDLFYRINVVPIEIPPLRDRRDDIPHLIEHFIRRFAKDKVLKISNEAMRALVSYHWPGNVRELRNVINRVALFTENEIFLKDLPVEISNHSQMDQLIKSCVSCFSNDDMKFNEVVHCVESNMINEALKNAEGVQSIAARDLKMNLSTFRDKVKKYKLRISSCESDLNSDLS
ncbi:MAG: sigma-54-dependent Fis family transcriptional regulator [Bacteroidetes bacterium]|nr:sigma-54-dependent Fis family transcriptional regulator [Bacteroidota bacterium]